MKLPLQIVEEISQMGGSLGPPKGCHSAQQGQALKVKSYVRKKKCENEKKIRNRTLQKLDIIN